MKKRTTIATFEAKEVQDQINRTKHERGRELLEAKLKTTYLESFVDLQKKKGVIICTRDYVTDKVTEALEDMVKCTMADYQVEKVDWYGYSELVKAVKGGEMEFPPKSSIMQPEIEDTSNEIPSVIVNGIDEIHCDAETRKDVQTLYDLKDSALQKMGFDPTSQMSGDEEAGEIRIIIETK
jgi:hypothetical protein